MILENLKTAGVQQAHKEDRIMFTSLGRGRANWSAPRGAIGKGMPRRGRKRAAIFIGPEFGTVHAPIWSPPREKPGMPVSTC